MSLLPSNNKKNISLQKGFRAILIFVILAFLAIILFVPLPTYQKEIIPGGPCTMSWPVGDCPTTGRGRWVLGSSLWERFWVKQKSLPRAPAELLPSPDPTANLSRDEVLRDWKTYTDPTGTFTIKYPSGFYETKENPGAPVIKGWSYAGHLSTSKNGYAAIGPNGMYFDFDVIIRKTDEDMKAFVNRIASERAGEFQPGDVSSKFKKYVNLGGKDSLWYEGSLGPAVIHTEVFIPHDDTHVVAISIWTEESSKTQQPYSTDQKILIDQILSTFKFLD